MSVKVSRLKSSFEIAPWFLIAEEPTSCWLIREENTDTLEMTGVAPFFFYSKILFFFLMRGLDLVKQGLRRRL